MNLLIERTIEEDSFDEVIELAIKASLSEEEMDENCEVSVTLCTNEEIAELNEEYMHRVGPTDVLSFPQLAFDEDRCIDEESLTYNGDNLLLGDIVISLERAKEQAEEFGHSERREVGFLTVHSMLHLLGYDHMEDSEREEMQAKEKKILAAMNLPRE
ncbi:MAG: rRNA maturation RNase YbeY [Clostridia bacterium]|nr:rRNA maturation RNase YbeY [Clostridia bacterium]